MDYFDKTFFLNPFLEYVQWISCKLFYQLKNWGKHLRIGYLSKISRTIFGKFNLIGRNVIIINSIVGDFTYIAENTNINGTTIGKFCSIGPNIRIAPGKHPTSVFVSTHPSLYSNPSNLMHNFVRETVFNYKRSVSIGNDVWIGGNVVIVDGITIGDGAIIAANSVVTNDVEPYAIMGGVPAKFIKKRFKDHEINFLLDFKWWDKSEQFIQNNIALWWSIEDFMEKFK